MNLQKQIKLAIGACAVAFSGLLLAEAGVSSCVGQCALANVTSGVRLKIVVPDVLSLKSDGSGTNNGNGELSTTWTYTGKSATNPLSGTHDTLATYTVSKP